MDLLSEISRAVTGQLSWFVFYFFLMVNGFYFLLMLSAAWQLRFHAFEVAGESRHRLLASEISPRISMLVPAFNEEATIVESLRAMMTLAYPQLEIVVVDDGSTDQTLQRLRDAFDLVPIHPTYQRVIETEDVLEIFRSRSDPDLIVARKRKGGKADALNAAINIASGELVCSLDADTLVEEDGLQRLVRPFIRSESVVAAGATIRVANGCEIQDGRLVGIRTPRTALAGIQAVEYLRAFLFGRVGWNQMGGNIVISGAFGLFRRDALMTVNGYDHGVGEDMDVIVRLRRHGYETGTPHRVEFVPDPVAWTEVPASLRVLGLQRDRWHRGLSETLWRHRGVLLNFRYRAMGMLLFPVFTVIEWLAPLVEAAGLLVVVFGLATGAIDVQFALLFFVAAYGLGMLLSIMAVLLEELSFRRYGSTRDRLMLLWWALIENLGYRQLTVWWRIRGMLKFFRGDSGWGTMERQGFARSDLAEASVVVEPLSGAK